MEDVVARYTRATNSSNLKCDEYHTDVDSLAAVAMSDKDFGHLLFRVKYAFDPTSYKRLLDEWKRYVKIKAVVHNWPQHVKEDAVASLVLSYWLNDKCRACGGKKHLELFPRVLEEECCPHCNGSGKRPIQCNGRLKPYVLGMLDTIERLAIQAGGEAMAKLASKMDF